MQQALNFVIVGDKSVGKTSLRKIINGDFDEDYIKFDNNEIYTSHSINISNKQYNINVYESHNNPEKIDGVILVFSVSDRLSYDNINYWYNIYKKSTNNFVLCGNKADIKNRIVKWNLINKRELKNIQYFDISARSNYNFEKPYITLIKNLSEVKQ